MLREKLVCNDTNVVCRAIGSDKEELGNYNRERYEIHIIEKTGIRNGVSFSNEKYQRLKTVTTFP